MNTFYRSRCLPVLTALVASAASLVTVSPAQAQANSNATLIAPANNQIIFANNEQFVWTPVVGAQAYYVYIGTTKGGKDVVDSGEVTYTTQDYTLAPGTYWVRLWTKIAGAWTYAADTQFTMATQAALTAPTDGAILTSTSETFTWSTVSDATKYYLYVGTTRGANDVVNTGELAPSVSSYAASGLPTGKVLYARIWTNINGTWTYADAGFTVSAGGGGGGGASPYAMYASSFQVYASPPDSAGAYVHSSQGGDLYAGSSTTFSGVYFPPQQNITFFGRYTAQYQSQSTYAGTAADYFYVSVRAPGSAASTSLVTLPISASGNLLIRMGNEVAPNSASGNGQANVFTVTMDNSLPGGAGATASCSTDQTLTIVGNTTATSQTGMLDYTIPLNTSTWTCSTGTLATLQSTGVSNIAVKVLGNKNTLIKGGVDAIDVDYISFTK